MKLYQLVSLLLVIFFVTEGMKHIIAERQPLHLRRVGHFEKNSKYVNCYLFTEPLTGRRRLLECGFTSQA